MARKAGSHRTSELVAVARAVASGIPDQSIRAEASNLLAELPRAGGNQPAGSRRAPQAIVRMTADPQLRVLEVLRILRAEGAATDGVPADRPDVAQLIDTAERFDPEIPGGDNRSRVMVTLVEATAEIGMFVDAQRLIHQIPLPAWRIQGQDTVIAALIGRNQFEEAGAIIRTIGNAERRAGLLTSLASSVLSVGDIAGAAELAESAETAARSINDPADRARELTLLLAASGTARHAGQAGHAAQVDLASLALDTANRVVGAAERDHALTALIHTALPMGHIETAVRATAGFAQPNPQDNALALVAGTIAALQPERAVALIRRIANSSLRDETIVTIAGTLAAGEQTAAVDAAIALADSTSARADAAAAAARAHAQTGDFDGAERRTAGIDAPLQRARAALDIATVRDGSDPGRASAMLSLAADAARRIEPMFDRAGVECRAVTVATLLGDHSAARRLTATTRTTIASIPDPARRDEATEPLVRAMAGNGDFSDAAAALANMRRDVRWMRATDDLVDLAASARRIEWVVQFITAMPDPYHRAKLRTRLIAAACPERTHTLVEQIELDVDEIESSYQQTRARLLLVGALATRGDWLTAEPIALRIQAPHERVRALATLIAGGPPDQVARITDLAVQAASTIPDAGQRSNTLSMLVDALTAAGNPNLPRI